MYVHSGNTQWFKEAGFGLFLHWGIYSLEGIVESWSLKRQMSENDFSGNSKKWEVEDYNALASRFRPENYDPEYWADLAKKAGMKYAVLTTKHHDGYCLFDTKTKDFNSMRTGPKRDLVGPYVEAFRKAGLKVGLYFSLIDWEDKDFRSVPASIRFSAPQGWTFEPLRWYDFLKRMFTQVEELLTNYGKIDLIFFDVPGWGANRWLSEELKMMILDLQPEIICNDRLPGVGDYICPEQQVPLEPLDEIWETCMTMNHQWSYTPDFSSYKSTAMLIRKLVEIRSKGGNLLLNVGPDANGDFPPPAVERLHEIGKWMSHSGESIYQAEKGISPYHYYGPVTRKNNTLYLHVFDPPGDFVEVRGIFEQPKSVRLLRTGKKLDFKIESRTILINVPKEDCDMYDSVVALDFDTPAHQSVFTSTVFINAGNPLW